MKLDFMALLVQQVILVPQDIVEKVGNPDQPDIVVQLDIVDQVDILD